MIGIETEFLVELAVMMSDPAMGHRGRQFFKRKDDDSDGGWFIAERKCAYL